MSPEQARGAEVDQRTDIWAFGCLLYELLAGKSAFKSGTVSDTIAAVLGHQPDWQALPAGTPAKIRDLLRRCLQKEATRRLNSIAEARTTLEDVQRGQKRWRFSAAQARQPRVAIPIAAMLLLLGFLGVRQYQHNSRVRWVREQAIPDIPTAGFHRLRGGLPPHTSRRGNPTQRSDVEKGSSPLHMGARRIRKATMTIR